MQFSDFWSRRDRVERVPHNGASCFPLPGGYEWFSSKSFLGFCVESVLKVGGMNLEFAGLPEPIS